MSSTGRLMSPQLSFSTAMQTARAPGSQAKGTISKAEAEAALAQLAGHPHATASERAQVVQAFLDGQDSKALSARAKSVLKDFVARESQAPAGGQRADELKAQASKDARTAASTLQEASARLQTLLAAGKRVSAKELAPARAALDAAAASVSSAQKALTGVLRVADHTAELAKKDLDGAAKELGQAKRDMAKLGKGAVTKAAVADVQRWLMDPLGELKAAQQKLNGGTGGTGAVTEKFPSDNEDGGGDSGGVVSTLKFPSDNEDGGGDAGGVVSTRKFPSDNEDGGGNAGGVTEKFPSDNEDGGAGDGGGTVTTMKAPSDNEDGGGDAGGVVTTMKFPSDNEDGGAGGGGGIVTTMKAPSDNEDGGPAPDGGPQPGPAPQPMVTRKAPSDHEDSGDGGIGAVTLKYPSDNEDGGGGGMMTTMKAPSDHEDGGPGGAGPVRPGSQPALGDKVKPERQDAMRKVLGEAQQQGAAWQASMPIGQRFTTVPLLRERHPDGFAFEALVPTGAMTPTAQQKDPNSVDQFWVRRTGGIAGLTQYAGPFSIAGRV